MQAMLAQAGYPVRLISLLSPAQYWRWRSGNVCQRLWLRLLSKLVGPAVISLRSLAWPRHSVIIANTNLLFAPLLLSLLAKCRRHKVVFVLYDLYPDALEVAAVSRSNSLPHRLLGALLRRTRSNANATVHLGDFLQAHAGHRYGKARRQRVIDVASPEPTPAVPPAHARTAPAPTATPTDTAEAGALPQQPPPPLLIRYGGQLGHMHCPVLTATATATAARTFGENVRFDFFASGPGVAEATPILAAAGIHMRMPAQERGWKQSLRRYHLALVALSPGGATVCFPSKTYGMLAAGLPLIAICPHWSDLAALIRRYGVGFVVSNSPFSAVIDADGTRHGLPEGAALDMRAPDYLTRVLELREQDAVENDFSALISRLLAEPSLIAEARSHAAASAADAFSQATMLERWQALIQKL